MPKPEKSEIQTSTEQLGAFFANLQNPTRKEREEFAAQISEQGKHLREMEAMRLKSEMKDRSNLSILLSAVLCVTLVLCAILLLCFDDPLKTQGAFTVMGFIITGWFSYLAGKRAV